MVDTGPTARRFSQSAESDYTNSSESDVIFVLDRIFERGCGPFKVRVEQVLQSQSSLITAYKLSNTLEFYCYTEISLNRSGLKLFGSLVTFLKSKDASDVSEQALISELSALNEHLKAHLEYTEDDYQQELEHIEQVEVLVLNGSNTAIPSTYQAATGARATTAVEEFEFQFVIDLINQ
ncbi:hypothetical protein C5167_045061, partial [Papaver somniferum]